MLSLKPSKIRFMHDQINDKFGDGRSVNETITKIEADQMSVHDLPTIRVCRRNGFYYAFDNRRLYVYRVFELRKRLTKITVKKALKSQFQPHRFSTLNNGKSVTLRYGITLDHAHATSPASSDDEDDKPTSFTSFSPFSSTPAIQLETNASTVQSQLSPTSTILRDSLTDAGECIEQQSKDALSSILDKVVADCQHQSDLIHNEDRMINGDRNNGGESSSIDLGCNLTPMNSETEAKILSI